MKHYAFRLDGKHKLRCPACGRPRKFNAYVDTVTGKPVDADSCGRCERIYNCGYHLPPREWFRRHPQNKFLSNFKPKMTMRSNLQRYLSMCSGHGDSGEALYKADAEEVGITMRRDLRGNMLYVYMTYMLSCFEGGREAVDRVFRLYNVGTSKIWGGSAIFWLCDENGDFRDGKVMAYDPHTGKRIKTPFAHITWTSALATKADGVERRVKHRPMFGQHLLAHNRDATAVVVEGEKAALMLAALIELEHPGEGLSDYVPVAAGSLTQLGDDRFRAFSSFCRRSRRSRVLLLPDKGSRGEWLRKADGFRLRDPSIRIAVSDYMEQDFPAWLTIYEGADIEDVISHSLQRTRPEFDLGAVLG